MNNFRRCSFSVQFVPRWVPGAGFQNEATQCKNTVRTLVDRAFKNVLNDMVRILSHHTSSVLSANYFCATIQSNGTALDSLIKNALEQDEEIADEDLEVLKWTAAILFVGEKCFTVHEFPPC